MVYRLTNVRRQPSCNCWRAKAKNVHPGFSHSGCLNLVYTPGPLFFDTWRWPKNKTAYTGSRSLVQNRQHMCEPRYNHRTAKHQHHRNPNWSVLRVHARAFQDSGQHSMESLWNIGKIRVRAQYQNTKDYSGFGIYIYIHIGIQLPWDCSGFGLYLYIYLYIYRNKNT